MQLNEKIRERGFELDFPQTASPVISLFQPDGELDMAVSPPAWTAAHTARVYRWLEEAFQDGASLFVAPEMAVPPAILHNILTGELSLPAGSLAILPLALLTVGQAREFQNHALMDYCASLATLEQHATEPGAIVNGLAYVYHVNGEQLPHFALQLKTKEMSHHALQLEALNLAHGNEFLHIDGDENFSILTAICSDVLRWSHAIEQPFAELLRTRSLLLVHPQLCGKPFHAEFEGYRRLILGNPQFEHVQILGVNWAGTTRVGGTEFFAAEHYPASGLWQKGTMKLQSPALFDANFGKGLYHHFNTLQRWDVFTFSPASRMWSIRILRNDGTSHVHGTTGYPKVNHVKVVREGACSQDDPPPDPYELLSVAKISIVPELVALSALAREAFASVAAATGVSQTEVVDPHEVLTCASDRDTCPLAFFWPSADLGANLSRVQLHQRLSILRHTIVTTKALWPPVLLHFANARLKAVYKGGPATLEFDGHGVAGTYIGETTGPVARRHLDVLLKTHGTDGPVIPCVWFTTGTEITAVAPTPASDITRGAFRSPTDITREFGA